MKHISTLLIIFIGITFFSCSPTKKYYFYSTLNSIDKNLTQEKTSAFKLNSNNLKLQYLFTGQNINMKLSIENEMPLPIFIDWNKSTIKVNDRLPLPISDLSGFNTKESLSEIPQDIQKEFNILNSAYFDLKSINKTQMQNKKIVISDNKFKTKSVDFDENDSPLMLTSNLFLVINQRDTIITNTFFISRISNIDKKTYNFLNSNCLISYNGFCTFYEINRGHENKFLDGVFDQLIKTSIYSIGTDGIRNYPKKYDEDTFYIPSKN